MFKLHAHDEKSHNIRNDFVNDLINDYVMALMWYIQSNLDVPIISYTDKFSLSHIIKKPRCTDIIYGFHDVTCTDTPLFAPLY